MQIYGYFAKYPACHLKKLTFLSKRETLQVSCLPGLSVRAEVKKQVKESALTLLDKCYLEVTPSAVTVR